jgi:hypothetical protein
VSVVLMDTVSLLWDVSVSGNMDMIYSITMTLLIVKIIFLQVELKKMRADIFLFAISFI